MLVVVAGAQDLARLVELAGREVTRVGRGLELDALAAVVIGGTSLFGGVGNVLGTAIGVVIISSINDGLILMNVPDFWQQIVVGCIILAAMVLDQITKAAKLPGALP